MTPTSHLLISLYINDVAHGGSGHSGHLTDNTTDRPLHITTGMDFDQLCLTRWRVPNKSIKIQQGACNYLDAGSEHC